VFAALTRVSDALRLRVLLELVCEQPWQAQQVVRGAAEDEDPVDLGQAAQLYLSQGSGPLEPAEGFLHESAAAQRAGIPPVPRRSSSMRDRRPFSFFCTCTVTFNWPAVATKSSLS